MNDLNACVFDSSWYSKQNEVLFKHKRYDFPVAKLCTNHIYSGRYKCSLHIYEWSSKIYSMLAYSDVEKARDISHLNNISRKCTQLTMFDGTAALLMGLYLFNLQLIVVWIPSTIVVHTILLQKSVKYLNEMTHLYMTLFSRACQVLFSNVNVE